MAIEAIGGLRVLAINILGGFLAFPDNNIRWVGAFPPPALKYSEVREVMLSNIWSWNLIWLGFSLIGCTERGHRLLWVQICGIEHTGEGGIYWYSSSAAPSCYYCWMCQGMASVSTFYRDPWSPKWAIDAFHTFVSSLKALGNPWMHPWYFHDENPVATDVVQLDHLCPSIFKTPWYMQDSDTSLYVMTTSRPCNNLVNVTDAKVLIIELVEYLKVRDP